MFVRFDRRSEEPPVGDERKSIGNQCDATPLFLAIASGKPDLKQTAYQIQVAASPEQLESGDGLLWDSGVVRSDESVLVPYAGKALESGKHYYWRVKLTTNQGDTPWSDAGSWSMALLDDSEWKATWIGEDSLSNPGEEVGVAGGNNKTRLGRPISA